MLSFCAAITPWLDYTSLSMAFNIESSKCGKARTPSIWLTEFDRSFAKQMDGRIRIFSFWEQPRNGKLADPLQ